MSRPQEPLEALAEVASLRRLSKDLSKLRTSTTGDVVFVFADGAEERAHKCEPAAVRAQQAPARAARAWLRQPNTCERQAGAAPAFWRACAPSHAPALRPGHFSAHDPATSRRCSPT